MAEKITFMERVESVLKQKKLTQTELAEKLNIRRPNLSDWKKNGAVPSGDIALKIAQYLNVSIEWLITGEEKGLTLQEREILSKWQELEEEQKETVTVLLNTLIEQNHKKEKSARAGA